MLANDDNRLTTLRHTIMFGGVFIPAIGSWVFSIQVLHATHPSLAHSLGFGLLSITLGFLITLKRQRPVSASVRLVWETLVWTILLFVLLKIFANYR